MSTSEQHYDPPGVVFVDLRDGRRKKLVSEGAYAGWIVWSHPDGQWVTERKATMDDLMRISNLVRDPRDRA